MLTIRLAKGLLRKVAQRMSVKGAANQGRRWVILTQGGAGAGICSLTVAESRTGRQADVLPQLTRLHVFTQDWQDYWLGTSQSQGAVSPVSSLKRTLMLRDPGALPPQTQLAD